MKKLFTTAFCIIGSAVLLASCTCSGAKNNPEEEETPAAEEAAQPDSTTTITAAMLPEEPIFDIETNLGTIRVKLYSKTPKHRDNFVKLALDGFYDGILFHRVIDGFMIQAGDPLTKDPSKADMYGTGGPGYTIPAEFSGELNHKKGALAAARRGDAANPKKLSSGSQFYIVQDENACKALDGEYTVFGETVEGFDVIDKIAQVPTDNHDRPVSDVVILSVKPVL